jgi:hypothetical protein
VGCVSNVTKLKVQTRFWQLWRCHRCGFKLLGRAGRRYCVACLWDELNDPTLERKHVA